MANLGGLPNLGSRRLSILQKQLNSSRKSTAMVNDRLKDGLERFERNMDKQKQSEDYRSWQQKVPVKKSMMEKRAIQTCLRRRRQSAASLPDTKRSPRNGVYDGVSLQNMTSEIKTVISEMKPSHQRTKKVEVLKSVGYRQGRLVNYDDSLHKFDHVLSRPKPPTPRLPSLGLSSRYSMLQRELPLHTHDFSSRSSSASSCDVTIVMDDETSQRRSASADGSSRRGLPGISGARRQSQYERSLPATKRKTDSQLPQLTRRLSSFGPY